MSMPETIDLPNADDFCRETFDNGKGQCCFVGWQRRLFPDLTVEERRRFDAIAENEGKRMRLEGGIGYFGITGANDDKRNTTKRLARWFARTVQIFGYDIEVE